MKPLGHASASKQRLKLFSGFEVFAGMQDARWLTKATDFLYEFVAGKNALQSRRKRRGSKSLEEN